MLGVRVRLLGLSKSQRERKKRLRSRIFLPGGRGVGPACLDLTGVLVYFCKSVPKNGTRAAVPQRQGYADNQSAHPARPERRRSQGQGSGPQVQSAEA